MESLMALMPLRLLWWDSPTRCFSPCDLAQFNRLGMLLVWETQSIFFTLRMRFCCDRKGREQKDADCDLDDLLQSQAKDSGSARIALSAALGRTPRSDYDPG